MFSVVSWHRSMTMLMKIPIPVAPAAAVLYVRHHLYFHHYCRCCYHFLRMIFYYSTSSYFSAVVYSCCCYRYCYCIFSVGNRDHSHDLNIVPLILDTSFVATVRVWTNSYAHPVSVIDSIRLSMRHHDNTHSDVYLNEPASDYYY